MGEERKNDKLGAGGAVFKGNLSKKSEYMTAHPADKMYRLEHSYRVANISTE